MSGQLWRDMLGKILMGSKYIWEGATTLNDEEYSGLDDQMGYFDHVVDFVSEVEKKAYMAGFLGGVKELIKEDSELVVDEVANQITAERRYLEWR